jgi:hypothetical protein
MPSATELIVPPRSPCKSDATPPHQPTGTEQRATALHPQPNKIYYIPSGEYIPANSILFAQERFHTVLNHPVLLLEYSDNPALVRVLPLTTFGRRFGIGPTPREERLQFIAIECLTTPEDDEVTIKVAPGSPLMDIRNWVRVEVFEIEFVHLQRHWMTVEIDRMGMEVIRRRLAQLETKPGVIMQVANLAGLGYNSYLHHQLFSDAEARSVINHLAVVLDVNGPYASIYPITTRDISNAGMEVQKGAWARGFRQQYLKISSTAGPGHDNTPVLLLDQISSRLTQDIYVKTGKSYWIEVNRMNYYQFPCPRLDPLSVQVLLNHHVPPQEFRRRNGSFFGSSLSPRLQPLPVDLPRQEVQQNPFLPVWPAENAEPFGQ